MTQGSGIIINKEPDLIIVTHYHECYSAASSTKKKKSFFNIIFVATELLWKYVYCKHLLLHTAFVL